MKLILSVLVSVLCIVTIIFAVNTGQENLAIFFRLLFKIALFVSFYQAGKIKFTSIFLVFLALSIAIDIGTFVFINSDLRLGFIIALLLCALYSTLILDAWKQFKMDRVNYTTWNYIGLLVLNGAVLIVHAVGVFSSSDNSIVMVFIQSSYNFILFAIGAVSLAYYLNSYSQKAMLFLVGNIAFLCSDILYSAFYFYGVGNYILPFGVLLSGAGYVFIFHYFSVQEEPLLLHSDILKEIEDIKERNIKHQV